MVLLHPEPPGHDRMRVRLSGGTPFRYPASALHPSLQDCIHSGGGRTVGGLSYHGAPVPKSLVRAAMHYVGAHGHLHCPRTCKYVVQSEIHRPQPFCRLSPSSVLPSDRLCPCAPCSHAPVQHAQPSKYHIASMYRSCAAEYQHWNSLRGITTAVL